MSPVRRAPSDLDEPDAVGEPPVSLASAFGWPSRSVPGAYATIEDALRAAADAYGDPSSLP